MTAPLLHKTAFGGQPIRVLKDDEQVTQDGLYYIPLARYHHDPNLCDGPSVSNSGLRLVEKCPEKYLARVEAEEGESDTKATTFGRMAHALCVEGRFPSDVIISPYDDFRAGDARKWKAEQEAAGLTVFKQKEIDDVYAMAERLAREPMVRDGLFSGPLEVSVIARDPETGIWLKARPDSLPTDTIWGDYKTTDNADPKEFEWSIKKYGYHCQAAFSAEVIALATGRVMESFALIAQEKKPPYVVSICPLDDESIEWGARENRLALRRLAHCIEKNHWPAYADGPVTVGLPKSAKQWRRDNEALFPTVPSLEEIARARHNA